VLPRYILYISFSYKLVHNTDPAALLTFVAALDQCLIDVMLSDVLQDVEETQVDSVRLFHNDVQQRLSGCDWTICQRLD